MAFFNKSYFGNAQSDCGTNSKDFLSMPSLAPGTNFAKLFVISPQNIRLKIYIIVAFIKFTTFLSLIFNLQNY